MLAIVYAWGLILGVALATRLGVILWNLLVSH